MMRACFAAFLGLVLLTSPVSAADGDSGDDRVNPPLGVAAMPVSRGSILPVLYGTLAGLQAYDGWSTATAVRRGAVEVNPVVTSVASNPGAMWAVKAGATMASIYAAERMWRRQRRVQAIATMIAINGMMTAVAVHNGSVVKRTK